MARTGKKRSRDGYRVTIAGQLGAADLRRLERACGPALEQRHLALQLDLRAMTGSDAVSDAFIGRLIERGARVQSRGGHDSSTAPVRKAPAVRANDS
jgi:hypothetical protein